MDRRQDTNTAHCFLVSHEFISGCHFYIGLLLLIARWLPMYGLAAVMLFRLSFQGLVTTVGHEYSTKHITDVVTNYGHGETIGHILG